MNNEEKEIKRTARRWIWWAVGIIILLMIVFGVLGRIFGFFNLLTDPDRAVSTYENFYQMHDQADQICDDIKVNCLADSVSGGFTRNERRIALENKLNDVIRDYNAQSQAITRNMWKADDLPHTLDRSDFNCECNQ